METLAQQTLDQVKASSGQWQVVADKIPKGEYHRYAPFVFLLFPLQRDLTRKLSRNSYAYQPSFILRPLVTAITLAYFLLHDDLIPLPLAAETIGSKFRHETHADGILIRSLRFALCAPVVKSEWQDRLQLTPDDYLQGVIGASNELVSTRTLRAFRD